MKNYSIVTSLNSFDKKELNETAVREILEQGIAKANKIAITVTWNVDELKMITTLSNGDDCNTTFELDDKNNTAFVVFENHSQNNIYALTKGILKIVEGVEYLI